MIIPAPIEQVVTGQKGLYTQVRNSGTIYIPVIYSIFYDILFLVTNFNCSCEKEYLVLLYILETAQKRFTYNFSLFFV